MVDLHLYLASWGTRRLMIRVPHQSVDLAAVALILGDSDDATIRRSGGNLIVDICREELETELEYRDDEDDGDTSWLAEIEPLRTDLKAGDLRLFYLIGWRASTAMRRMLKRRSHCRELAR